MVKYTIIDKYVFVKGGLTHRHRSSPFLTPFKFLFEKTDCVPAFNGDEGSSASMLSKS